MTTRNTLGPWDLHEGYEPHNQGQVYDEGTGATVAVTYNDPGGEIARLIAAAPDLLAACLQVLGYLGVAGGRSASTQVYERVLREAIAKATEGDA